MSNVTIENENAAPAAVPKKTAKRSKAAQKAKPAKKAARAKKPASERANKKAEVMAIMKRAGGATLEAIMQATGWQAHTVRGFVSILGSKGGLKIDSAKIADGQRTCRIAKYPPRPCNSAKAVGRRG